MKKAKRLTRKEKKKAAELLRAQPKPVSKPRKNTRPMLTLSFYLQRQAKKKHDKMHERQEKRDAKAGKPHVH